jgi:hypothetical protein
MKEVSRKHFIFLNYFHFNDFLVEHNYNHVSVCFKSLERDLFKSHYFRNLKCYQTFEAFVIKAFKETVNALSSKSVAFSLSCASGRGL